MSAADRIMDDSERFEKLPPIFEFHQTDGKVFKIYVDGRTEGFGKGFVVNRIPQHIVAVSKPMSEGVQIASVSVPHHGSIGKAG